MNVEGGAHSPGVHPTPLLPVESGGATLPHQRRVEHERARAAAEALAAIGLAAAVLDGTGSPLAINALFEALVPDTVRRDGSRIVLADPAAHTFFVKAFMALRAARGADTASIPLRARAERVPMILHLLPLRETTADASPAALTLVAIMPILASPRALATETLRGLFDLSRAEARVARRIGRGLTVDAIAEDLAISRETVRCQLKSVLAKTGAKRQLDLAVLLNGPRIPGRGKNRAVNPPPG
jgi:DNA-binding CsgD family transcriptional regulator